jgi:hypothetical protein
MNGALINATDPCSAEVARASIRCRRNVRRFQRVRKRICIASQATRDSSALSQGRDQQNRSRRVSAEKLTMAILVETRRCFGVAGLAK